MARVAFLGLGVMGYPMAGHLKKKGHAVTVYNRTTARAEKWVEEFGGSLAATPSEAARDQEFVFACVGNDDDLRTVAAGPQGAFGSLAKAAVFVDHTSASAEVARELHKKAKAQGCGFVDAPVSGGQSGAETGALSIMCGADSEDYARAEPIISSYAKACRLMGPPGSGQLTKMVNQICIKDLALCLEEARHNGATLPVAALVDQFYAEIQKMGGARWDTSSLIARLERS
jgi:3-hydroxyisobutyrate dehydrogenase